VLLDAANNPLRPAILWNDSRASAEASEFASANPSFEEICGAAQSPSFWPAKLLWLQRHEPEVLARMRHMLAPKDYLRFRLTGLYQTDPCEAGGTLLLDEVARGWSAPILRACSVTLGTLPTVVEGDAPAGRVLDGVAEAWGLPKDVVVAGGGGDAACGAISIGAVSEGEAYISLGTVSPDFRGHGGLPAGRLRRRAGLRPCAAKDVVPGCRCTQWRERARLGHTAAGTR
jgi:xylulokinase